jgi:hypothetical protein
MATVSLTSDIGIMRFRIMKIHENSCSKISILLLVLVYRIEYTKAPMLQQLFRSIGLLKCYHK